MEEHVCTCASECCCTGKPKVYYWPSSHLSGTQRLWITSALGYWSATTVRREMSNGHMSSATADYDWRATSYESHACRTTTAAQRSRTTTRRPRPRAHSVPTKQTTGWLFDAAQHRRGIVTPSSADQPFNAEPTSAPQTPAPTITHVCNPAVIKAPWRNARRAAQAQFNAARRNGPQRFRVASE